MDAPTLIVDSHFVSCDLLSLTSFSGATRTTHPSPPPSLDSLCSCESIALSLFHFHRLLSSVCQPPDPPLFFPFSGTITTPLRPLPTPFNTPSSDESFPSIIAHFHQHIFAKDSKFSTILSLSIQFLVFGGSIDPIRLDLHQL
ncbi:hypothetical protein Salat_0282100 [Sesamum alatum]|uniref:Uncharacterized protein n=1 Tax=Sesamum alatum TaxID=300844 RepID=A0AAE2CYM9_9LAMI|nr:hypothetical protein Salat_0282100 [Sesamum alatum]